MFITNNHDSLHLWRKENLLKYQKVSKYYVHDCSCCNNNLLILDVKQLNKIMKLYYFHTFKALWNDQGKIKMYYGMSSVKKQLSGKSLLSCTYVPIQLNLLRSWVGRKKQFNFLHTRVLYDLT